MSQVVNCHLSCQLQHSGKFPSQGQGSGTILIGVKLFLLILNLIEHGGGGCNDTGHV